ncbi:hypothetical protein E1301_Tti016467 [Triplophysa tibetana]|uniref:Uncharacterized protein n=1 Tax=Triplophysa tibetana TaxID=1572043 RepID=A0A5A9NTM4_9TELE|nr:hypothetical protein E1301_Tti016467 [Triplophysa tibetana]
MVFGESWPQGVFRVLEEDKISFLGLKIDNLKIDNQSIRAAEQRYLEDTHPNRTHEQRERQKPFLDKFTTSPAFDNEKSRYGNFRFTFPLTELMEEYRNEMCGGKNPVLREFKTIFYKQEIMLFLYTAQKSMRTLKISQRLNPVYLLIIMGIQ